MLQKTVVENLNFAFGRVGIITNNWDHINDSCKVVIDNLEFLVNVFEDATESIKLIPPSGSLAEKEGYESSEPENCAGEEATDFDTSPDPVTTECFRRNALRSPVEEDEKGMADEESTVELYSPLEPANLGTPTRDCPSSKDALPDCSRAIHLDQAFQETQVRSQSEHVFSDAPYLNPLDGHNSEPFGVSSNIAMPGMADPFSSAPFPVEGGTKKGFNRKKFCRPPFPLKPLSALSNRRFRSKNSSRSIGSRYSKDTTSVSNGSIDLNRSLPPDDSTQIRSTQEDGSRVADSNDVTSEIRDTMEVGNMVGFNMVGCELELRKVISNFGDVSVNQ